MTREEYFYGAHGIDIEKAKQAKTGWIPVSERLPKISGWYLVTGSRGAISVRYWRKAIPQQGGSYWRGSVNPIAWMPLPEPYKAESEDEECR